MQESDIASNQNYPYAYGWIDGDFAVGNEMQFVTLRVPNL